MLSEVLTSVASDIIWFLMELSDGNCGSSAAISIVSGRTPWGTFFSPSVDMQPASSAQHSSSATSATSFVLILILFPRSPRP